MKKIATHNGVFHADEVTAVALLKLFGREAIGVTRVPHQTSDFDEFDLVLDVGRVFDGKKYFDHHQYKGGKSSAGLIWDYISETIHLFASKEYKNISELVKIVDDNDVGIKKAEKFSYCHIISSYNTDNIYSHEQNRAFDKAVDFALDFLLSLKNSQDKLREAEAICKNAKPFMGMPEILELPEFVQGWQNFINGETMPNIRAVVWFDKEQKNWQAQIIPKENGSFELHGKKFPEDESMDFVHAVGFFAVAKDKETMVNFLRNSN